MGTTEMIKFVLDGNTVHECVLEKYSLTMKELKGMCQRVTELKKISWYDLYIVFGYIYFVCAFFIFLRLIPQDFVDNYKVFIHIVMVVLLLVGI